MTAIVAALAIPGHPPPLAHADRLPAWGVLGTRQTVEALDECLAGGRIRLRGSFGRLEPLRADRTLEGIRVVLAPRLPDSSTVRLVHLDDLTGVDRWEHRTWRGFDRGFQVGEVVGIIVVIATQHDRNSPLLPLIAVVGGLPFAIAGGVVGAILPHEGFAWKRCWSAR